MIVVTTTDARGAWAKKISDQWRNSVNAIIQVGSMLAQAKKAISPNDFAAMIANDLPFGERAAQMMVAVGQSERLANHGSALPASWRTLYELQRLPEKIFEKAVKDGRIHPDMERREVAALAEHARPAPTPANVKRPEPRDAQWTETPAQKPQPAPVPVPPARTEEQIDTAIGLLDSLINGLALLDPLAICGTKSQSKRDKIKTRIERARAILSDFEGPLA
jgi:hypothetical protein